MKKILGLLAGILPIIALLFFSMKLAHSNSPQNLATWAMWFVLDAIIAASMFAAGNKKAWLPTGYGIGALLVSIVLFNKGDWKWTPVETICLTGSVMAMAIWYFSGPKGSIVVASLAMWIASFPMLCDTWILADQSIWIFWAVPAGSSLLALYAGNNWSIQERFFPTSSFVFNSLMTYLVLT